GGIAHYRERFAAQRAQQLERMLVLPMRRIAFDKLAHATAVDACEIQLGSERDVLRHARDVSRSDLTTSPSLAREMSLRNDRRLGGCPTGKRSYADPAFNDLARSSDKRRAGSSCRP